jgi:release factor glutamine methyltransferase
MTEIKSILEKNILDPLDAELTLAHVINKPREFIIAHPEHKITKTQETKYKTLIKKRAKGVPLAYLTGHKEFYGLDFAVNKYTLIPRPDTEIMVEAVIATINKQLTINNEQKILLVDVGTGSGCIPISILKSQSPNIQYSIFNIKTFVIDSSLKALSVARKNAKLHQTRITFLHGNLLVPFVKTGYKLHATGYRNIILTANLPYLTNQQYLSNPDLRHEPKSALVAKNNGLFYYEQLLKQITKYSIFNIQYSIFLEIDPSQSKQIKTLINQYLPNSKIEIKKDLAGRDRVVIIMMQQNNTKTEQHICKQKDL